MASALTEGPVDVVGRRWVYSLTCVIFDPWQVPPWAWQEAKGEAMVVNKADYTTEIVRQERLQTHQVDVAVRRWCCPSNIESEVSNFLGKVEDQPRIQGHQSW